MLTYILQIRRDKLSFILSEISKHSLPTPLDILLGRY
jgi:hypothetical protein